MLKAEAQAKLVALREQLAQVLFEVEALKGNVKDWRKAYEQAQQNLADMQKHRDSWREYAYGNREKPLDFRDGNKVNRGKTALEDAQRELEEALGVNRARDWSHCGGDFEGKVGVALDRNEGGAMTDKQAPAEGAEQFWPEYLKTAEGQKAYRIESIVTFRFTFAEAYAASLREQLAQAQAENDRLTDAFLVYETIQPDGSLRATLKDVLKGLAQAQFEVEALKGNVKDWRKAYEQAQAQLRVVNGARSDESTEFRKALVKAQRELEEALKVVRGYQVQHIAICSVESHNKITGCPCENCIAARALARSTGTKEGQ